MLIYLVVIVVPALVLLYLGLESVRRQSDSIRALHASNLRLSQDKLAGEVKRREAGFAEACLRETVSLSPTQFPKLRERYPIARNFFLIEDGTVRYPALRSLPPQMPAGLSPEFRKAEEAEIRDNNAEAALAGYRRAVELPAADTVTALALGRAARCLEKLKRHDEAAKTWRVLAERYGDFEDPSHRPYALVAGLELGKTDDIYRDLTRGRWALSADQVDYYLQRLKRPADMPQTRYLEQFQLARVLEDDFRHVGSLRPDETYTADLPPYRLYYRSLGANSLIGFSVDSDWVHNVMLPRIQTELGLTDTAPLSAQRGVLIYGGAIVLVLSVLALGVILLIRDVVRETRVNQLRAEFVSGVSHELRTPLTLIRLYGETLLESGNFAEEERRGFYRIITRESQRLTHLIEKVLTFSRIERGEKQYRLQQGDLATSVARTVEAYEQYLERRGFTVEVRLDAQLPPVRFDPDGVSQAVVNLLDNAVKYSGDSKYVGVRLSAGDGKVIFEVEDRGIGIPRSEQEKVFERFYRSSNAEAKGGYGLGLFMVRHIMEAHGGSVDLDSEQGRGSRFRLIFPVAA